jgi:predicted helicase
MSDSGHDKTCQVWKFYILDLLLSVIHVSVQTVDLVGNCRN